MAAAKRVRLARADLPLAYPIERDDELVLARRQRVFVVGAAKRREMIWLGAANGAAQPDWKTQRSGPCRRAIARRARGDLCRRDTRASPHARDRRPAKRSGHRARRCERGSARPWRPRARAAGCAAPARCSGFKLGKAPPGRRSPAPCAADVAPAAPRAVVRLPRGVREPPTPSSVSQRKTRMLSMLPRCADRLGELLEVPIETRTQSRRAARSAPARASTTKSHGGSA